MLTKEAKQIIDYAIPIFEAGKDTLEVNQISKETGLSLLETNATIEYLAEHGYFKVKRYLEGSFIYSPSHKALHYKDFESNSVQSTSQTNIFNAPVNNSAIGNTGNITINNGISFSELRSFIDSQNISDADKAEAIQVADYVETLTENEVPLKKGFLSKFGNTLSKLDWLPELLGKVLITYFSN